MARIRHLSRAPIAEALIDLRVHAKDGLTPNQLTDALDFGYRKTGPIVLSDFGLTVNMDQSTPSAKLSGASNIVGARYDSLDGKYVAQCTTTTFTFSRLAPYESWESLIEETQRVWIVYKSIVEPTSTHRIALRYINNLQLPIGSGDRFEKYLTGLPNMPPEYPQTVSGFLHRFVIDDEPSGTRTFLTQALEQTGRTARQPVILDIDVIREAPFSAGGPDVWDCLAKLRDLKNRFFFGAITEDAADLYA